jgi:enterochelin esterase family protein
MKRSCLMVVSLAGLVLAFTPGAGQAPRRDDPGRPRFGQAVRSPEVTADGRVTFRFHAPIAKEVFLAREGAKRLTMVKDDQGTWSVTTEALEPDFYSYRFVVDGLPLADPANPLCVPIVTGGHNSIVHVPGPASLIWEVNDVPHGTLHRHCYRSKSVGEVRDYWVYTPACYDPAARRKYPVLYLLHGVMDDASAWMTMGRANVILDNLIARGKAEPMLVVCPLGYGFPNVPDRVGELFQARTNQQKLMDDLATSLLDEVVPQVERNYHVAADPGARAIAGVSMGGVQALYIGLNHRDSFSWIGSFSGAIVMYGGRYEKFFPGLGGQAKTPPRLLWLSCGSNDFLLDANRRFRDWVKANKVPCKALETPGAHAWPVWRRNLAEFAPLLFRKTGE